MRRGLRMSAVLVVCTMAALGLCTATAGATRPPAVTCGQTITTSVVLRADLACTGDGLTIAAGNVTVWLAGHTISSTDGSGVGIRLGVAPTATDPPVCVGDVAVRGGTISGFAKGIAGGFCNTTANQVSGLDLQGNTWGIYLQSAAPPIGVDHTTIVGPNGIGGPFLPGAPAGGVNLTSSRIRVTAPDGFSVLSAFVSSTIDSSRIEGGRAYGIVNGSLTIRNSRLTDSYVDCSDANVDIRDTVVLGGGLTGSVCGFYLADDHFIGRGSGVGAALGGYSYPTTVTRTEFTGWDKGVTLIPGPATITDSTFRHNGTGLVACSTGDCGGTISGNAFYANGGTGLLLPSGTWHVGSNLAARNGGLGIDAHGAVIDDGGNVARRNLPPQCVGVVCTVRL